MQKKYTYCKILFIVFTMLFTVGFSAHLRAQNLGWAKRLGGADYEHGRSIATDAGGNVYTLGEFRGTEDFDPGAGIFNLTSFSACCYDILFLNLMPPVIFYGQNNWVEPMLTTRELSL